MSQEFFDVLFVRVAGRSFGLPVWAVREVLPAVSLSPPPTAGDPREGVMNLRGRGVPVVDLASALGFERTPLSPSQQLVVLEVEGEWLAVRSEEPAVMESVCTVPAEEESRSRSPLLGETVRWEEQIVWMLDVAALLDRLRGSADSAGGGGRVAPGGPAS